MTEHRLFARNAAEEISAFRAAAGSERLQLEKEFFDSFNRAHTDIIVEVEGAANWTVLAQFWDTSEGEACRHACRRHATGHRAKRLGDMDRSC